MSPNPEQHEREDRGTEGARSGSMNSMNGNNASSPQQKAFSSSLNSQNKSHKKKAQQRSNYVRRQIQQLRGVHPMARCIPNYLKPHIHPLHGDFCCSRDFHPQLIVQLMAEGFLPMCSHDGILLPKLHQQRSCILLREDDNNASKGLHTSKSTRKKASKYALTWNRNWNEVVQGCREQHGDHCWLYPALVESFYQIYVQTQQHVPFQATLFPADAPGHPTNTTRVPVRMLSIELWALPPDSSPKKKIKKNKNNQQRGQQAMQQDDERDHEANYHVKEEKTEETPPPLPRLVAGELGYAVGAVYTSLTGFTQESSAGSVQLAALGSALKQAGFQVWDLGMDMAYKKELGATPFARSAFLKMVHQHRLRSDVDLTSLARRPASSLDPSKDTMDTKKDDSLMMDDSFLNARVLIDAVRSPNVPS